MMEPMTLGSPAGNSTLNGTCSTPQGFLPGYLIGGSEYCGSSPSSSSNLSSQNQIPSMISPSKLNRSIGLSTTPVSSIGRRNETFSSVMNSRNSHRTSTADKSQGGPPVTGLYSNVGTPNHNRSSLLCQTPNNRHKDFPSTPNGFSTPIPNTPHLSFGATPNSSHFREEIPYTANESAMYNSWITIFGFPPSASAYILSQFSQYGSVLQHYTPPNGNWMHIKYQTKIQAQKALSKNGKVFGGNLMIGVGPCTDESFTNETGHLENSMSLPSSVANLNSSLANRSTTIRPLTQAYKVAQSEHEVLNNPNTPDKANGFVNKAMEFIFGW